MGRNRDRGKASGLRSGQWRAYALATGAAAVALAVLIALAESGGDSGGGDAGLPSPRADATPAAPASPHVLGDAAAPVTLLEYSDFR